MEGLSLTARVDLGEGSKGQNSTFSEHGHVAYQIKENHEGSILVAIILPADLPLPKTLGMRSVGQNSTISEHVNVAYQINENQECSNMVAKILTADPYPPPPPEPRVGVNRSKFNFFRTSPGCISN